MDLSRRDTLRVFGATAAGAFLGASGAGAFPEPILRAIPSSGERLLDLLQVNYSLAERERAHLDDDLDAAFGRLPDERLRRRMADAL